MLADIAERVFADGTAARRGEVTAGQIARLSGLAGIQIGDAIGAVADDADQHYFPPPTLETAMVACNPRDKPRLHAAITELAEQDPLINVRQDDLRQEIYVSLYGEVQKQVICSPTIKLLAVISPTARVGMIVDRCVHPDVHNDPRSLGRRRSQRSFTT